MADRRLQVFYTVARQLSFTRAAEQLCMTQPAVTFQIKQLEEHFDARLFERDRGGIVLTPAGRVVLDYAERILELNDELDQRVGDLRGAVSGPLLLGCSMTIAEFILPRILGEFKALHPQVQPHMTVANSETIENRVADHTIDLGLIESPAHLPGLHTEVCCDDELVMICAPDYPLAKHKAVTARQIAGQPYVSREAGSGTREFADQYLTAAGVGADDLNIVMELGSPEAIKGVVETGIGIAIMSRASVAKELRLGSLVALPLKPRLMRQLSLVYPQKEFRSRLLSTFVDFATQRMRAPAGQH
jgi:DNA-binding transcriptional LysR family regulator